MQVNIYCGNHAKKAGIDDIIDILKDFFVRNGCECSVSVDLDSEKLNVVIDEFVNYYSNISIIEHKRCYPQSKLLLVATEFVTNGFFVKSFNAFGGIVENSILAVADIAVRKKRSDLAKLGAVSFLKAFVATPFCFIYLINNIVKFSGNLKKIKVELYRKLYLLMRFHGFVKFIPYFDGCVLIHPSINVSVFDSVNLLGSIYPTIDASLVDNNIFINKKLGLAVSGTITGHRKNCIKKIYKRISELGLKSAFSPPIFTSFDSESNKSQAAYSIHPPQSMGWSYSSPTRIYRAIVEDGTVPIVTKKFNQHHIEDLCYCITDLDNSIYDLVRMYNQPEVTICAWTKKIQEYNRIAQHINDNTFKNLRTMYHKE